MSRERKAVLYQKFRSTISLLLSCIDFRYTRQVLDETLRCSVLAPYAARVYEFDLQVGQHTIPAEVRCLARKSNDK